MSNPPFSQLHNSQSSQPPLLAVKSSKNENGPGVAVIVGVSLGSGVSVGISVGVAVGIGVEVSVGNGVSEGTGVVVGGLVGGTAAMV